MSEIISGALWMAITLMLEPWGGGSDVKKESPMVIHSINEKVKRSSWESNLVLSIYYFTTKVLELLGIVAENSCIHVHVCILLTIHRPSLRSQVPMCNGITSMMQLHVHTLGCTHTLYIH